MRDTIASVNIRVGGQVCTIVDSVSYYDDQPSTYVNVAGLFLRSREILEEPNCYEEAEDV